MTTPDSVTEELPPTKTGTKHPESKEAVHGRNTSAAGSEFTICGMAFDAWPGDAEHPIVMAAPGETVNCEACRRTIKFMKTFKRWKQP